MLIKNNFVKKETRFTAEEKRKYKKTDDISSVQSSLNIHSLWVSLHHHSLSALVNLSLCKTKSSFSSIDLAI